MSHCSASVIVLTSSTNSNAVTSSTDRNAVGEWVDLRVCAMTRIAAIGPYCSRDATPARHAMRHVAWAVVDCWPACENGPVTSNNGRDVDIREQYHAGRSAIELGAELGLSRSQNHRIVATGPPSAVVLVGVQPRQPVGRSSYSPSSVPGGFAASGSALNGCWMTTRTLG